MIEFRQHDSEDESTTENLEHKREESAYPQFYVSKTMNLNGDE